MNNKDLQFLNKFAVNLNEMAAKGKLDPVIGRDEEIRRVLQILSRRTKNNPILVGEPGVGKTAISEGIAQKIVDGNVPENLKSKTVYSLDMGALIAGAKYQGEFEERLKGVVKEVVDSAGEIILFIDDPSAGRCPALPSGTPSDCESGRVPLLLVLHSALFGYIFNHISP